MFSNEQLHQILLSQKIYNESDITTHLRKAQELNLTLYEYLELKKILSERQLYEAIALFFGIPFLDLKNTVVRKDVLTLIPEAIAQAHHIIAFDKTETDLKIAALNPKDLEIFNFLKKKTNLDIEIFITTPSAINDALKSYHIGLKAEFGNIQKERDESQKGEGENNKDLKELAQDLPVIRIVDTLLEYAIFESASDIHVEPEEKELNIRYRVEIGRAHV